MSPQVSSSLLRVVSGLTLALGLSAGSAAAADPPFPRVSSYHGLGSRPLVEESAGTQTLYIYGPSGLLAVSRGKSTYFVAADHLGSTRAVFQASGDLAGSFSYDPYGVTTASDPSTLAAIRLRYTGQEFDAETGLYYDHARIYDPSLRRFLSVDPARQTPSPYEYVGNDPIDNVDPSGRVFYRRVGEETLQLLRIGNDSIREARKRIPFAGNITSEVSGTGGESHARADFGRITLQQHFAGGDAAGGNNAFKMATSATAACGGFCDDFSALTHTLLTTNDRAPIRHPIYRVADRVEGHSFTLIGDPRALAEPEVVVVDAWTTVHQATTLADAKWLHQDGLLDLGSARVGEQTTTPVLSLGEIRQRRIDFATAQFGLPSRYYLLSYERDFRAGRTAIFEQRFGGWMSDREYLSRIQGGLFPDRYSTTVGDWIDYGLR